MSDQDQKDSQPPQRVTHLLQAWQAGDGEALDLLMSVVYHELHGLAERYMRSERADHTLQPTSLVHEAYLRLVDSDVGFKDRVHFFAVASTIMRRVLIDHARARKRIKRDGKPITLDESVLGHSEDPVDILALDEALNNLAKQDDRKRRVIELIYFGGLTYEEVADVLGVSPATVDRDHRMAKAWLYRDLHPNKHS